MNPLDPKNLPEDSALERDAAIRLAQAGIRASDERIRALSLLMKFKGRAWTVPDLRQFGMGEAGDAAVVTRLYRSLHLMEKEGVVEREIHETPGRPSFAYRLVEQESVIRFQCRDCRRVVATDSAQLRAQVNKAQVETGLPVSTGDMLVMVTCSRCAGGAGFDTNGLQ